MDDPQNQEDTRFFLEELLEERDTLLQEKDATIGRLKQIVQQKTDQYIELNEKYEKLRALLTRKTTLKSSESCAEDSSLTPQVPLDPP